MYMYIDYGISIIIDHTHYGESLLLINYKYKGILLNNIPNK